MGGVSLLPEKRPASPLCIFLNLFRAVGVRCCNRGGRSKGNNKETRPRGRGTQEGRRKGRPGPKQMQGGQSLTQKASNNRASDNRSPNKHFFLIFLGPLLGPWVTPMGQEGGPKKLKKSTNAGTGAQEEAERRKPTARKRQEGTGRRARHKNREDRTQGTTGTRICPRALPG